MSPDRDFAVRSRIFRLILILLFLVLLVNLFIMMGPKSSEYKGQALENRQVRFRVRAPRGRVADRQGVILADNLFIADITLPATCLGADGPDSTLTRLMDWFGLPPAETQARLINQKEKGRGRLVLVGNATMPQIAAVEERGRQLPGVRVEARARRRYQYGSLFAHLIGYVGEVGQADLDTTGSFLGYRQGDFIGKQGIEATFEDVLRGTPGRKLEEVNASGRIVGRGTVWVPEVQPGRDVVLSISLNLQNALAEAIGQRVACGVAMSVTSGEVLAAFSNPSFDPNLMTVGISADQWNAWISDPAKPFFNRVIHATYPPGSLYKPVTSLAGLSLGLVDTATELEPCLGGWNFGDRYFRCWKHSGHGRVDHLEAMVHSCDTFYYQLGLMMDIDQLAAAARAFGLGRATTDIFPDEAPGNIPDTDWYNDRFGERGWTRGVLLNNAIGQGEILVTPLQMSLFAARLASGGRTPDPVFVISPPQAERTVEPLPFDPRHLAWCREAMLQVVVRGSGINAALDSIPVAGKTGTAQNPHGEDHAWFMGFAPADKPEVALVLLVENGGGGGAEAAPVAKAWLEAYFADPNRLAPAVSGRATAFATGETP